MRQRLSDTFEWGRFLVKRFLGDRAPNNAAALTYTTLFAVVPIMTVTFAMLSAIPAFQGTEEQIQIFIFHNFVPSTGETLEEHLRGFIEQARHLTWLGVALLAVTSLTMLVTIEKTFNDIWRVSQPRRGMSSFLLYWAILSLGPLLLGAGFAISTYIASLSMMSGRYAVMGTAVLLKFMPLLFSMAAFTLLYAAVPNTRVPLKHALVGGIFTSVLFEAAKSLFGLYVMFFPGYKLIYGAFATIPLFLVWIYVSWLIVLFGAELVCNLSSSKQWRRQPIPTFLVLLGVLRVFLDRQQTGASLDLVELQKSGWKLPEDQWQPILDFLKKEKLVCHTSSGRWVLCRDLNTFTLTQLMEKSPWHLPEIDRLPEVERCTGDWYPPLIEALKQLHEQREQLLGGSLAKWLKPEAKPVSSMESA
ncbi:YihY family inner membrane protein [Pseudomonas luteola]|uniref:YihY family inner membrane protein n=1 Tax=Pseudomonas luteola TaxID=47886 RepID=UPI00123B6433|nr:MULTISPECIES: YihY family inner membrane protein [Pseudomonas]MBA1247085.1 YihY family inner membrane protein [Pseudomonas zeshuii]QEU28289.1 YihY family inner membrane protein [Pseudomonas luteola]